MYKTNVVNIAVVMDNDKHYISILLVNKIVDVYLKTIWNKREGQLKLKSVAKYITA